MFPDMHAFYLALFIYTLLDCSKTEDDGFRAILLADITADRYYITAGRYCCWQILLLADITAGRYYCWQILHHCWQILLLADITAGRYYITAGRYYCWQILLLVDITAGRYYCRQILLLTDITAGRYYCFQILLLSDITAGRYYCRQIFLLADPSWCQILLLSDINADRYYNWISFFACNRQDEVMNLWKINKSYTLLLRLMCHTKVVIHISAEADVSHEGSRTYFCWGKHVHNLQINDDSLHYPCYQPHRTESIPQIAFQN